MAHLEITLRGEELFSKLKIFFLEINFIKRKVLPNLVFQIDVKIFFAKKMNIFVFSHFCYCHTAWKGIFFRSPLNTPPNYSIGKFSKFKPKTSQFNYEFKVVLNANISHFNLRKFLLVTSTCTPRRTNSSTIFKLGTHTFRFITLAYSFSNGRIRPLKKVRKKFFLIKILDST